MSAGGAGKTGPVPLCKNLEGIPDAGRLETAKTPAGANFWGAGANCLKQSQMIPATVSGADTVKTSCQAPAPPLTHLLAEP